MDLLRSSAIEVVMVMCMLFEWFLELLICLLFGRFRGHVPTVL